MSSWNARRLAPLLLSAWLAARAAFMAWLLFGAAGGLYFYSGDYPSRVLIAYQWLAHPSWLLGGIWLPGNFYLTGLVLKLWDNPTAAPAVFHILLSCGSLALVYALARELFAERPWAALWSVLWLAFEPLLSMLSISGGASEVDEQFFLLAGAWTWLRFERSGRTRDLLACAALFGAAGFIRHEAWCFMAWPALSFLRRAARGQAKRCAAALLLMWAPAAAWVASRAAQGDFLLLPVGGILSNLRRGVPLAAVGRVSAARLFWAYPAVLWSDYRWFLLGCLAGAALAWRAGAGARGTLAGYFAWLGLAFFGLCLTPVFSIVFAPAHVRVAAAFLPFLAPLLGLALDEAASRAARHWRPAPLVLALGVLTWTASAAARAVASVPSQEPCNAQMRAQALALVRLRPKLGPRRRLLIEMAARASKEDPNVIWDYAVFQWAAAPYAMVDRAAFGLLHHADGSYSLTPATRPSVLADRKALGGYLDEQGVAFALVRSTASARALSGLMRPISSIGPYTLLARDGSARSF